MQIKLLFGCQRAAASSNGVWFASVSLSLAITQAIGGISAMSVISDKRRCEVTARKLGLKLPVCIVICKSDKPVGAFSGSCFRVPSRASLGVGPQHGRTVGVN